MISVIVCSIDEESFNKLSISIKETIGLKYEIIKIQNGIEDLSLTEAYNKGAKSAKFEFLVFIHEDIIFNTRNWGVNLKKYFSELDSPGVLGVAGSSYLPISPSDWWLNFNIYLNVNLLSNVKRGVLGKGKIKQLGEQVPKPVFLLDGLFLAMKLSVWKEIPFDESLVGFHGYDTSICLRVSQKYQNYFVPGILMEHFSAGYPNEIWLINTIKAKESIQPYVNSIKKNQILNKKLEIHVYHLFLNQLKKYSSSLSYSFRYSFIYLIRLNRVFISFHSFFLWFVFQFIYIFKFIKNNKK